MPLALDGHAPTVGAAADIDPTAEAAADINPTAEAAGRGCSTPRAESRRGPDGEADLTAAPRAARAPADT